MFIKIGFPATHVSSYASHTHSQYSNTRYVWVEQPHQQLSLFKWEILINPKYAGGQKQRIYTEGVRGLFAPPPLDLSL